MKEVEAITMTVPVFAIDEKCENCPNLTFEIIGKTALKCKNAPICWKALEMREGERNE
jgi:hypothetical protein